MEPRGHWRGEETVANILPLQLDTERTKLLLIILAIGLDRFRICLLCILHLYFHSTLILILFCFGIDNFLDSLLPRGTLGLLAAILGSDRICDISNDIATEIKGSAILDRSFPATESQLLIPDLV